jgi:hypothetical protein
MESKMFFHLESSLLSRRGVRSRILLPGMYANACCPIEGGFLSLLFSPSCKPHTHFLARNRITTLKSNKSFIAVL